MTDITDLQFNDLVATFAVEQVDMLTKRGAEYNPETDPFYAFSFACEFAEVTIDQAIRVLMGIKLARIKQLSKTGGDCTDSLLDLACYTNMLNVCLK